MILLKELMRNVQNFSADSNTFVNSLKKFIHETHGTTFINYQKNYKKSV